MVHRPFWERLGNRYNLIKQAFSDHPNVSSVTAFRFALGLWGGMARVVYPEETEGSEWRMYFNDVDENFFDVFEVDLIAGRNFSADIASDSSSAFILNETAVKELGWTDPLGKTFGFGPQKNMYGTVIGVVRDFHQDPLREKIKPVVFCMRRHLFVHVGLKIRSNKIPETFDFLKKTWTQFVPERPLQYWFLDRELEKLRAKPPKNPKAGNTPLTRVLPAFFFLSKFTC